VLQDQVVTSTVHQDQVVTSTVHQDQVVTSTVHQDQVATLIVCNRATWIVLLVVTSIVCATDATLIVRQCATLIVLQGQGEIKIAFRAQGATTIVRQGVTSIVRQAAIPIVCQDETLYKKQAATSIEAATAMLLNDESIASTARKPWSISNVCEGATRIVHQGVTCWHHSPSVTSARRTSLRLPLLMATVPTLRWWRTVEWLQAFTAVENQTRSVLLSRSFQGASRAQTRM
jgi:hypothetical protein